MATLIFLHIEVDKQAIKGESTVEGFIGQIEIESFHWGINALTNEEDKKKARSSVQFKKVSVTKFFDRSSTNLCQYMATRKEFSSARLTFSSLMMDGVKQSAIPIMELTLKNGYIEEVRLAANESGRSIQVKENVDLSFKEATITYHPTRISNGKRIGAGSCIYTGTSALEAG